MPRIRDTGQCQARRDGPAGADALPRLDKTGPLLSAGASSCLSLLVLLACLSLLVRLSCLSLLVRLSCLSLLVRLPCLSLLVRLACLSLLVRLACLSLLVRLSCLSLLVRLAPPRCALPAANSFVLGQLIHARFRLASRSDARCPPRVPKETICLGLWPHHHRLNTCLAPETSGLP